MQGMLLDHPLLCISYFGVPLGVEMLSRIQHFDPVAHVDREILIDVC